MLTSVMNGYKVNLIQNVEELRQLRKEAENFKTFGGDTETTGLSFLTDKVVGLCVAFGKPLQGYYMPIRHVVGKNLPMGEVMEFAQFIISFKKTMWFNRNFDFNMLELDGVKIPYNGDFHDAQPMCWMASNEKMPSLKKFCRDYLHWKMIDFGEAANPKSSKEDDDIANEGEKSNYNFGETDPEQSYVYAAFDPVATLVLGRFMFNNYPYIRKIYPLDNLVTEAVRRMGKVDVQVDYKRLQELSFSADRELRDLKSQIVAMAGYEFNIGSNKQKAEALSRYVTLTVKTKSGQFSVKDEVLEEIDHPLAKLLVTFSKKSKFINSFIKPLQSMQGKPIYFNFKTCLVPTGRMACGKVNGNPYYARMNIQALPKTKVNRYIHEGGDLGYYLDDNPENAVGQQETKAGFRDCFICPEDSYFVTSDYCGEEVCIAASMSQEPTWINAINNGHDVHMESARVVFGIADKAKRAIVKTCTFLVIYGGAEFTLSRRLKVSVDEARAMFNAFHKGLGHVSRWIKYTIDQARRKGMIFTYYGRPRLLYKYYQGDRAQQQFADRSAVNTICQGCLPIRCHFEFKDKAVRLGDFLVQKFKLADGREAITSSRGTGRCYAIIAEGEFAAADSNHGYLYGSRKEPKIRKVCDGLNEKIQTSPLQSKWIPSFKSLLRVFSKKSRFAMKSSIYAHTNAPFVNKTRKSSALYFIGWLLRWKFTYLNYYNHGQKLLNELNMHYNNSNK